MGMIIDLWDKAKRYFKFSLVELRAIIVAIIIIAFIISFRQWGIGSETNIQLGLKNFFISILIASLVFIIYHSAQRLAALFFGYRLEYRLWTLGWGIGLLIAFITNGWVWILIPGAVYMHFMPGHRLGMFRYDHTVFSGMTLAYGPLALIWLAIGLKGLSLISSNPLLEKFMIVSLVFAFTNMLPIPPLDGSKVFYATRLGYCFLITYIIGASVLLLLPISATFAFFGSVIIAIICWFLYYIFFEERAWDGP